ncbi:MAG: hypothetical protein SGJ13_17075 [Actinomycetota bacterium]|nr:hypothetical protein [Actinomycetota bacterium]
MAVPDHPNAPRRAMLALAFAGIVFSGLLGGAIGWGLVDTTCSETPTVAEYLLDDVPGYDIDMPSCDLRLIAGAVVGTLMIGIGAGVIAGLMLRAQSEWRAHPPDAGHSQR